MIKTLPEYVERMQQMTEEERKELLSNFTLDSFVRSINTQIELLMNSFSNACIKTPVDQAYMVTLQHAIRTFAVMHSVAKNDADMAIANIINEREKENGDKSECSKEASEKECENCHF